MSEIRDKVESNLEDILKRYAEDFYIHTESQGKTKYPIMTLPEAIHKILSIPELAGVDREAKKGGKMEQNISGWRPDNWDKIKPGTKELEALAKLPDWKATPDEIFSAGVEAGASVMFEVLVHKLSTLAVTQILKIINKIGFRI